ncbi:MAG: hypothetical protein AAF411_13505 [Myxococcota bacterium]
MLRLFLCASLSAACASPEGGVDVRMDASMEDGGGVDISGDTAVDSSVDLARMDMGSSATALAPVHEFDERRAEAGRQFLLEEGLGGGIVPTLAMENLWIVWGTGPMSGRAYWQRFAERYGFVLAAERTLPFGLERHGSSMGFNCLTCHVDRVAGEVIIGAANGRVDLERLYDDLVALNGRAPDFGFPSLPVPFELDGFTGAPGSMDAFGLAMELAGRGAVETDYGHQQAAPWWTLRYKRRIYADGSGDGGGFRTMMATTLTFGRTLDALIADAERYEDLRHYLLSLEAPRWPFAPPDERLVSEGAALFQESCADCHGDHQGGEHPDRLIDVEQIGTDPIRTRAFTEREASAINASWFGEEHPMRATSGYLAPPLVGVWATAPYFHNGAVPTLAGVLNPAERPERWVRDDGYDEVNVGLQVRTASGGYDAAVRGLDVGGHDYASEMSATERTALLAYLKTL